MDTAGPRVLLPVPDKAGPRVPTDAGIQSISVTTFENWYKVGEGIV
jgi:hypothetical protein